VSGVAVSETLKILTTRPDLQQTPATAKSIALKVVVLAVNHVFNFTSPTAARNEQVAVTDALREAISEARSNVPSQAATPSAATDGEGQPTVAPSVKAAESWYNDQGLKTNVELQQSLLRKDPALRQRFEEALREKPEGITNAQFSLQFWSARVHLLRAHAIERAQTQGAYNVLSEVKPKIVDGATRLNLSKEQIQLIFNQHPLVKHVYNDVVPKLSEMEFWARFFVSRLFKKLKGERITDADSNDAVLDKYLSMDEFSLRNKQAETYVPHFIDLEGNEQNHSQRRGNAPDFTMRPNASEKVPILRALNNMSEKMMVNVAPTDGDPHGPVGMDEETYAQLRLRDLQADDTDDRVVLNIKDQNHLFGSRDKASISAEAKLYAKQDPNKVIGDLRNSLTGAIKNSSGGGGGGIDLSLAIGFREEDSDSENDAMDIDAVAVKKAPNPRVGSRAALRAASAQVTSLIAQQRTHLSPSGGDPSVSTTLTPGAMASLHLTHNTTTEFLHYFWTLFLAPGSSSATELASLLGTLTASLARIAAVAATAEKDRDARIAELKAQAAQHQRATGRKMRLDESMLGVGGGGKKEVDRLMAPTVAAIARAKEAWEARARDVVVV